MTGARAALAAAGLALLLGARGVALAQAPPGPAAGSAPREAAAAGDAEGATLSPAEYAASLARVEAALRAGDTRAAQEQARPLLAARVAHGGETLATDASLLGPLARGEGLEAGGTARTAARLAALRHALAETPDAVTIAADKPQLERLRRGQQRAALARGGEVGDLPLAPPPVPERVRAALEAAWGWLGDAMHRLWEWLKKLWPGPRRRQARDGALGLDLSVLALVGLALGLIAVLALRALRGRREREEGESEPGERGSSRDEDPLSREADEWEAYARRLAEQGRRREAIRAFYHAVLVTLFRSGRLHYQKGRTNWEYVARVGPEQRFRAELVELTRLFDREWYGHASSSAEALGACAAQARRILAALRGADEAAA